MAVLGGQLVITLIMASIIQKMNAHISFARWLLCHTGLVRYLDPTDDQLRTLAGIGKEKGKGKNHQKERPQSFHVSRNIDIDLETAKVGSLDVMYLRYFTEYQWLVDFSIYAAIVYVSSEVYSIWFPAKEEVNLSMVWCLLVIFFALKLLGSLTVLYFRSEESIAERSMCIIACLVYLLIAMIVLTLDDSILETGLEQAYTNFNKSASAFLAEQGVSNSGPASKIVLKFFIAVLCGLLGSLFTFPGLRIAQMHWDSLKYCRTTKLMQIILNTSFALPFVLVVLWIKPISRDYLTDRTFGGMDKPILTSHAFEAIRLLLMIFAVLLRFALLPTYLQAYLNIAYDRIESMKKEGGRITNIELRRKISSVFSYLCVVTLQFAAPLILCLFFTLMYKSLSGFSWFTPAATIPNDSINEIISTTEGSGDGSGDYIKSEGLDLLQSAQTIQASWHGLRKVFSSEVYKGFLGFAVWWSYFSLFATSALGVFYQSYFTKV